MTTQKGVPGTFTPSSMCMVNLVRLTIALLEPCLLLVVFFSWRKVSPDSLFEQELKVQVKSVEHVNNQWSIRADIAHQSRSGR